MVNRFEAQSSKSVYINVNAGDVCNALIPNQQEASKAQKVFSKLKDKLFPSSTIKFPYERTIRGTNKTEIVFVTISGNRHEIKELNNLIAQGKTGEVAKAVNKLFEASISKKSVDETPPPSTAQIKEPKSRHSQRVNTGTPPNTAQIKGPNPKQTVAQAELKRAIVKMLTKFDPSHNNETLAEAIAKSGLSEAMDIPKLIEELPVLYPNETPAQIAEKKQKLMTEWMSLDAGHEWGIGLKYSIGSQREKTTGSDPVFTNCKAASLASDFMKAEGGKLPLSPKGRKKVVQATLAGAKAAQNSLLNSKRAGGYLSTPGANRSVGEELRRELDANGVVAIPTGWSTHGVGITLHKAADGKYFLYYCNRGGRGFEKAEDRALMGGQKDGSYNMVCFEIENPAALTPELLGQIPGALYHDKDPQVNDASAKPFIEGKDGLFKILGLKKVAEIPKSAQKTGNCTWANCKGSVHAAAIAAAYDDLVETMPRGNSNEFLTQAIHTGGTVFKKMERFGRKQSLGPLLKYDGSAKDAPISPFDHLRVLSAAGRKLTQKAKETENSSETRSEDSQMRLQVIAKFNQSNYSIRSISHPNLGEGTKAQLMDALQKSENGSYAFVNNECWVCVNGKVHSLGQVDANLPLSTVLSGFRSTYPQLTFTLPVFLEQSSFTPIQELASLCRAQIKGNANQLVDLRNQHDQKANPLKDEIALYVQKLNHPNTPAQEIPGIYAKVGQMKAELAQMESQFEQIRAIQKGTLIQSLHAVQSIPDGNPPSEKLAAVKAYVLSITQKADIYPSDVQNLLNMLNEV